MLSRRELLQWLGAGAAVGGLGGCVRSEQLLTTLPLAQAPQVLRGSEIDLHIGELAVNISGRTRRGLGINQQLPGPVLRLREGDAVRLRVYNHLADMSSIHWHGLILPANMDGVPGFSFDGIASGHYYDYQFTLRQHGTYWYHSHSGLQEQQGLYGALIVEPREPEALPAVAADHVLLFSDWSDERPEQILATLKKQADFYNQHRRTLPDFVAQARRQGWRETAAERWAWSRMRMSSTDLADVSGKTYHYLLNGCPVTRPWMAAFQAGQRLRLRLINASAMSYLDFRIPGCQLTVVAADGQPVVPVVVDELRLAVAETYDVLVELGDEAAYTLFAQAMDRSGAAVGFLVQPALLRHSSELSAVPALDQRFELTMAEMGHDHSAAGHTAGAPGRHSEHSAHHAVSGSVQHPATETGNPLVDMQALAVSAKLDDPGIGLRDNGRRVLAYGDLRSRFADPDGRAPSREIVLHLTGHMERFAWSIDGVPYERATPIVLRYGERVRFTIVNDTMMHHPMHLHGLWSDLEDEHGNFMVRKHTVDIPPGGRRSYRVTADALGRWAFHCHMLLHMEVGMFREVRVIE